MKTITRWIFIETAEGGTEYYGDTESTRKECREKYQRLRGMGKAFGKPGSKVEYIKLTGTRK